LKRENKDLRLQIKVIPRDFLSKTNWRQ